MQFVNSTGSVNPVATAPGSDSASDRCCSGFWSNRSHNSRNCPPFTVLLFL